jgi:hypothetical protein
MRLSFMYGRSPFRSDVLCVLFITQREHNTVRRSATPAMLRPMSWRRSEEVQDEDTAGYFYFLMLLSEAIAPVWSDNWHGQRRADLRHALEVAGTLLGACSGVPVRAWRQRIRVKRLPSASSPNRDAGSSAVCPGTTGISGHRYCRRVNTASKAMVWRPPISALVTRSMGAPDARPVRR